MKKWGIHKGSLPTVSQLIALEATARLGSFSKAAEEVSLTQGAIAQQIRGLEQALGISLFNRVPHGLVPTQSCHDYVNRVQLALGIIEEATLKIQRQPTHDNNSRIILSTSPSFASRWLIPQLPSLNDLHPDIKLMIDASSDVRSFQGKDKIDIAIRWGSPPFQGVKAHFFFSGNLIPVCAPKLLGTKKTLLPKELPHLPLISDSHDNWREWLTVYGDAMDEITGPTFSQTSHSIDAAKQGMGIALVPEFLVVEDIKIGSLVLATDKSNQLKSEEAFYILTRDSLEDEPVTTKILAWLLDKI
jgi:LysR family glycine cleavage system transcriptional activator